MSLNKLDRNTHLARKARWLAALGAAAALAACGGGGGDSTAAGGSTPGAGTGTLRVALTDAPSCGYDNVWITVEKVRVNQSATAADEDAGWSDITLAAPKRLDLLELSNGVLAELGSAPVPTGHYNQVRLVLAANGAGSSALANAVKPTGGSETALSTPSATQSGLKIKANFDVAEGQAADLVLDFDACRSVVKAGNSGQYLLKPVIAAAPRILAGLQGYVTTTLSLSSTTVAAQQDGVTVRSTKPDSTGKFSIPYLSTGTYTLVVTSDGHATAVLTGVPSGTTTTVVNGTATAIAPPVSAMGNVSGTVTASTVAGTATTATPLTTANVRALQALTGGPSIEVANVPVDGVSAGYAMRLPVAPPVKASYATGSTATFTFAPDAAVAGKYTLQAQAPNRTPMTQTATVTAGTPTTANFSFLP
jgi:hypothetical protein